MKSERDNKVQVDSFSLLPSIDSSRRGRTALFYRWGSALALSLLSGCSIPNYIFDDELYSAAKDSGATAPGSCDDSQLSLCGEECVVIGEDPKHCEGCNQACSADQLCQSGVCQDKSLGCTAPTEECGGGCVDTSSNPKNCGGCGNDCGEEGRCVDSKCETITEICNNGIDDDGNGDIDCADAACSDFQCVPPAPAGWVGPYLWRHEASSGLSCGGTYPVLKNTQYRGLDGAQANCSCACDEAAEPKGDLLLHQQADCSDLGETISGVTNDWPADSTCYVTKVNTSVSYLAARFVLNEDSCSPRLLAKDIPSAFWNETWIACDSTSSGDAGGCSATLKCLPPIEDDEKLCVSRPGKESCPADFPENNSVYANYADSRDCGCSCDAKVETPFATFGGTDCVGTAYNISDSCSSLGGYGASNGSRVQFAAWWKASSGMAAECTPSPTQSGIFNPTQETTVCCRP